MLKLRNLHLDPPVLQSPMSGCTDLPFRLIAREHGAGFAFAEMLLADAVVAGSDRTFDRMKSLAEDRPLGAQLVGYTPESLGAAAKILEEAGFDLIDLNLGCPVKKVTCKGGGSAVLKNPVLAESMFSSMTRAVISVPVTVKMRLGFDDPSGAEAVRVARLAESCGISAITVHGRTGRQGYSGQADYEAIGRVKNSVGIPVIGNGDVIDSKSARRLLEVSGCDGIMIGRGGMGYPWIFSEIAAAFRGEPAPPPPDVREIKKTLFRHIEYQERFTPGQAHILLRRIACGYFKSLPGAAEFRSRVNAAESVETIRRLVEEFEPGRSPVSAVRSPD